MVAPEFFVGISKLVERFLCLRFNVFILPCYLFLGRSAESGQRVTTQDVRTTNEFEILSQDARTQIFERREVIQRDFPSCDPELPLIYVITPTYSRPVQEAELTRLSQTFMHICNLHWIVIEDSPNKTGRIGNLLASSNLNYTHLIAQSQLHCSISANGASVRSFRCRGIEQRNAALTWLRKNKGENDKGVVYFADEWHAYAIQVFDEMRFTKEVSVWPVGFVGGLMVEKPLVDLTNGKVSGWNNAGSQGSGFPIDISGFAINLQLILKKPAVFFSHEAASKRRVFNVLRQLTARKRLEPKADNCTQVIKKFTELLQQYTIVPGMYLLDRSLCGVFVLKNLLCAVKGY